MYIKHNLVIYQLKKDSLKIGLISISLNNMSYIWNMQNCISDKWLKLVVKNNLVDQFKQTWTSKIENSSKGIIISYLSMI